MEFGRSAPDLDGAPDPRRAARFFQALGDPTRLRLLRLLREGERTVGDLVGALGVPQPKVSRHLKVLREVGLVHADRDGRNVRCRLTSVQAWPVEGREWIDRLAEGIPLAEEPSRTPRPDLETHLL
jgi:DNA-binding transcriptional ArsR family regulator